MGGGGIPAEWFALLHRKDAYQQAGNGFDLREPRTQIVSVLLLSSGIDVWYQYAVPVAV